MPTSYADQVAALWNAEAGLVEPSKPSKVLWPVAVAPLLVHYDHGAEVFSSTDEVHVSRQQRRRAEDLLAKFNVERELAQFPLKLVTGRELAQVHPSVKDRLAVLLVVARSEAQLQRDEEEIIVELRRALQMLWQDRSEFVSHAKDQPVCVVGLAGTAKKLRPTLSIRLARVAPILDSELVQRPTQRKPEYQLYDFADELLPKTPAPKIQRLEQILNDARTNPPRDKQRFVETANRLLDLLQCRVELADGRLATLCVRSHSIQFSIPQQGSFGGFAKGGWNLVQV